ncbi:MAG TPA: helix-turn-helix domain-containing protein [Myxococcota bacterium]|nr:helix-turn-helix domain-containing protein [Myxococcota bacterium]
MAPSRPSPRSRRASSAPTPSGRASRLAEIVAAAGRVVAEKGYERTQMSDVARALGISAGNLYNYVESKEALFHLLVEQGFGCVSPPPLPEGLVRTPAPGETLALLRRRLVDEMSLPMLDAALARRGPPRDARGEVTAVVRELYRVVGRNRQGIRVLERSAHEWPELAALFYAEMRRGMLDKLRRWIAGRIEQGVFVRVAEPAAAARFVNESIAWFAMHRFADYDAAKLDDRACEETAVMLLANALLRR